MKALLRVAILTVVVLAGYVAVAGTGPNAYPGMPGCNGCMPSPNMPR